MSLNLALNSALTGLKINQQALGVLSHNVANANTPGYSRQVLHQSSVVVEGKGAGVRLEDILRKIDVYVQRSVQNQGTTSTELSTISGFYEDIQNYLGNPGGQNSIDTALTGFFNGVQNLAQAPETSSLKSNAISGAAQFAKQISDLARAIEGLRFEADSKINDAVNTINETLKRIQTVNIAIQQAKALGQSTADMLDTRDAAVNVLADHMSISTFETSSGAINVMTGNGVTLVEDGGLLQQLRYNKATSIDSFTSESTLSDLKVVGVNDSGQDVGISSELLNQAISSEVKSGLQGGKLEALHQIRDVQFPAVLKQLDMLASRLRDEVNAIHNDGSGFPPATSLTGDRVVNSSDAFTWLGTVRIAALRPNGTAVPSYYPDETYTGLRPLTLDLSTLDSGQGQGKPTIQTIIDEINNHFSTVENKAKLGNLNNIQLVSDNSFIPSGATSLFDFDLDLDNISATNSKVFVTDMTVLDDLGANITSITQTAPSYTVANANSYITTNLSADVTVTLTSIPNIAVGETIYLNAPGAALVNGIPAAALTGFFTVTAVSGSQVTFTAGAPATASGAVADASGVIIHPPYVTSAAGIKARTRDSGTLQVDFTASPASLYYDVTLNVSTVDADGVTLTAPITYRVYNNQQDLLNKRYSATAVAGAATLVQPTSTRDALRAVLVDADGNVLPTDTNGKYLDANGTLKIIGSTYEEPYSVAIDEMNSKQLGKPDELVPEPGTNRGFSHFFGLNNFFASNALTVEGDALKNSALNLRVEDRLTKNANFISTGALVRQNTTQLTNGRDVYTYIRYAGDDSIAQRISQLNNTNILFDAAGGLPTTEQTFGSYTAQIMGSISQQSAQATANAQNAKTLYDTFKNKSEATNGVNLDEELANTIIFQNAYSATARVLTSVNKMYDELLATF